MNWTPVTLEPPSDFSQVDDFKNWPGPTWIFKGYTRDQVIALFADAGIPESRSTSPQFAAWQDRPGETVLHPTSQGVFSLSQSARAKVYSVLDDFTENDAQRTPYSFRPEDLDRVLAQSGLRPDTQDKLRSLLYPQGDSLLFADVRTLMSTIPDHDEQVRLYKTICHRPSMSVFLRVPPGADIDRIVDYWKIGGRSESLRPLLTALSHVDGGGSVDLTRLLPEFVQNHVYTFPAPTKNPVISKRDCHWTSLNFFNSKLDDRYTDAAAVRQAFDTQFEPVAGDPKFGDVVLLINQDNVLIHSATYLADNIVFTKNGALFTQPWTYMKLPDLVDYYNTFTPQQQPLKVVICRRKVPPAATETPWQPNM